MKITISNQKENRIMKRNEIKVVIEHERETTPSFEALRQLIAKEMKKETDYVEVIDIVSEHGIPKSVSRAYIWHDKKVEPKKKKKEVKKSE